MHKNLTLDPSTSTPTSSATLTSVQSHAPLAIPMSTHHQMAAMKPMPMQVGQVGQIGQFLNMNQLNQNQLNQIQAAGIQQMEAAAAAASNMNMNNINQKHFTAKMRVGVAANALRVDRTKFAPY